MFTENRTNGHFQTVKSKGNKKPTSKRKTANKPKFGKVKGKEKIVAGLFFFLSVCGLFISLPHIATELSKHTNTSLLFSGILAIIIDFGMIASKVNIALTKKSVGLSYGIVLTCTAISIILNCSAFLSHSETIWQISISCIFGVFIPVYILTLSYIGVKLVSGQKD